MPTITLNDLQRFRAMSPRRKRFLDSPIVRQRPDGSYILAPVFWWINDLVQSETSLRTRMGQYGPFRFLNTQNEIDEAIAWQTGRQNLIFLRDTLRASLAIDFNLQSAGVYTACGQAEHEAKATQDEPSITALVGACASVIRQLGLYRDCDAISAVPPSPDKAWDLPTELVTRVSAATGKASLVDQVRFTANKASVKALPLDEKWDELERGNLVVTANLTGKRIVLIDDKYQSGTTAQFVASKLYEAGAAEVLGLFCVKTWRDTDNT